MKKLLCILCLLVGIFFFNSAWAYYYRPHKSYSYTRHYGYRSFYRPYYRTYRRPYHKAANYGFRLTYPQYW